MHMRTSLVTSAKRRLEESVVTCLFGLCLPLENRWSWNRWREKLRVVLLCPAALNVL